ncbi:hypothetical protein CNR22_01620 [Sphingobacteriaceae bacterium]|nr:hypothetical protein CNR22_01620 [Sphingobacteriaceae bacterium]
MRTILVVEDKDESREDTSALLKIAGFRVVTATKSDESFQQTITHHPDLILSDLVMPKAGGMKLLETKKKIKTISGIAFVFLSAGSASIQDNKEYKADAYISKPFTYKQLLKTINHFLKLN